MYVALTTRINHVKRSLRDEICAICDLAGRLLMEYSFCVSYTLTRVRDNPFRELFISHGRSREYPIFFCTKVMRIAGNNWQDNYTLQDEVINSSFGYKAPTWFV